MANNLFWKCDPGNAWNPLVGFPRNAACFCGSGSKAKRCCLPRVAEFCSSKKAAELKRLMPQIVAGTVRIQLSDNENGPAKAAK